MKYNCFRNIVLAVITAFVLASFSSGAEDGKAKEIDAGMFLAPLNGAINIKEGTLETWFYLDYSFDDYLRIDESDCYPFPFLNILDKAGGQTEKDFPKFAVFMAQQKGAHSIAFANTNYYAETKTSPPARYGCLTIPGNKDKGKWLLRGEWHLLAVTWKIDNDVLHVEMFLDGKLCCRGNFTQKDNGIRSFSENDLFSIGSLNLAPATILSCRISNRVRTNEEIASANPLKPDGATTFFLDGDMAGKINIIKEAEYHKMRKSGKIDIKKNGAFVGKFKIIDTAKGKAIQFFNKLSR
ncbi:MAG: hypothetical protein WAX69_22785 [Victivallales bacterium]